MADVELISWIVVIVICIPIYTCMTIEIRKDKKRGFKTKYRELEYLGPLDYCEAIVRLFDPF